MSLENSGGSDDSLDIDGVRIVAMELDGN
jgi:hypothetical protein